MLIAEVVRGASGRLPVEIFQVDHNPSLSIAHHVIDRKLDEDVVFSAPSPLPIAWFEWPIGEHAGIIFRVGTLYGEGAALENLKLFSDTVAVANDDGAHDILDVTIVIVAYSSEVAGLIGVVVNSASRGMLCLPNTPKAMTSDSQKTVEILTDARYGISSACFLLTTPKAVEIVPHQWDLKLQRSRAKHGKSPLLEFKHVRTLVGEGAMQRRYEGSSDAGSDHMANGCIRSSGISASCQSLRRCSHAWPGLGRIGAAMPNLASSPSSATSPTSRTGWVIEMNFHTARRKKRSEQKDNFSKDPLIADTMAWALRKVGLDLQGLVVWEPCAGRGDLMWGLERTA